MGDNEPRLVSRVTVFQQGTYSRVLEWYEGHHPKLGALTFGWNGHNEPQTVREIDVVRPLGTFMVSERSD